MLETDPLPANAEFVPNDNVSVSEPVNLLSIECEVRTTDDLDRPSGNMGSLGEGDGATWLESASPARCSGPLLDDSYEY